MINITIKLRSLIEDGYKFCSETFTYNGSSKIFTLKESNISSATIIVKKNGVIWSASNYSFDSNTCDLTITGTLADDDVLTVTYNAYKKYSDTELQGYICAAITKISGEHYGEFVVASTTITPTPTEAEENMIALVATIMINKSIARYQTPDFTIQFIENESIDQKIRRIVKQFNRSYGSIEFHDLNNSNLENDYE